MGLSSRMTDACTRLMLINEIPLGLGLPLRILKIGPDGSRAVYLDTTSALRAPLSDSILKLPKGYTPVDSFMAMAKTKKDMATEQKFSDLLDEKP